MTDLKSDRSEEEPFQLISSDLSAIQSVQGFECSALHYFRDARVSAAVPEA